MNTTIQAHNQRAAAVLATCKWALVAGVWLHLSATAQVLNFSTASATYTQPDHSAAQMINGVLGGENGWAIYRYSGAADETLSESVLFTLGEALAPGTYDLTITLHQNFPFGGHLLGHFALGTTTDSAPTLASASTPLPMQSAVSLHGSVLSLLPGGRILASGPLPAVDVYTLGARFTSAAPVTGVFLQALNDPAAGLPFGGPGRYPANGNFVITEFDAAVTAVPEPTTAVLLLSGLALAACRARR